MPGADMPGGMEIKKTVTMISNEPYRHRICNGNWPDFMQFAQTLTKPEAACTLAMRVHESSRPGARASGIEQSKTRHDLARLHPDPT